MTPGVRLGFVVWGIAVACGIAACFLTVVFVDDMLSNLTNNTGSLAWPIGVVLIVFYFAVAGTILAALVSSIAVLLLNEANFFAPWSRMRVRVWALTATLAILLGLLLFPRQVRRFVEAVLTIWG
jgi:hypothetical protein